MSISSVNTSTLSIVYNHAHRVKREAPEAESGNRLFISATRAEPVKPVAAAAAPAAPAPLQDAQPGLRMSMAQMFGDLDNNGTVDGVDLGMLLGNFGSKGGAGDLNHDGAVDGKDLNILKANWGDVQARMKKQYDARDFGDVNSDGKVDGADLGAVLGNFGAVGKDDSRINADINGDGMVDDKDVKLVNAYWGNDPQQLASAANKLARSQAAQNEPQQSVPVLQVPHPDRRAKMADELSEADEAAASFRAARAAFTQADGLRGKLAASLLDKLA